MKQKRLCVQAKDPKFTYSDVKLSQWENIQVGISVNLLSDKSLEENRVLAIQRCVYVWEVSYRKMTHNEDIFRKKSRNCWREQSLFCVSASSVHLASVFPSETFRVHCTAQVDWICFASPVAAGNASTVQSSSAAAQ